MNSVLSIPVDRIDGTPAALREFAGKVLLVVNVASKCGFTPQYTGLEALYESHRDQGLVVLGFPANDFGAQEPGTNDEVATFCATTYGVQFPMFSKISVKGPQAHPLYRALIEAQPKATESGEGFIDKMAGYGIKQENPTDIFWNFEKFLIARDGTIVGRYHSDIAPDSPVLLEAIERELAKPAA